MRFFKSNIQFNWKYIFGEILLIFIGISLAVWFNNWNSSIKTFKEKEIAISKIKEEINSNIKELSSAQKINQPIINAYSEYKKIYHEKTTELITTPENLNILQRKYPRFSFVVSDSVKIGTDLFHYSGSNFITLEFAELSQIAWETTRSIKISNEFNFDCLYKLESMYNLQRKIEKEIEKATSALQKSEIKELMSILNILNQYDIQLVKDYNAMLSDINNCH